MVNGVDGRFADSMRRMFVRGNGDKDSLFSFIVGHISMNVFSVVLMTFALQALWEYFPSSELDFLREYSNIYVLGFLALLIWVHEISHMALMRQHGVPVFGFLIPPVGGIMVTGYEMDAKAKIPSWLAGPASGLVALPMLVAGDWLGSPHVVLMACVWAAVNWFNLLPIFPLDGGWIVKEILQAWISKKAAKKVIWAGSIGIFTLASLQVPDKRALIIPVALTVMLALIDQFAEKVFSKFVLSFIERQDRQATRLAPREVPKVIVAYLFWLAILTSIMVAAIIVFANM